MRKRISTNPNDEERHRIMDFIMATGKLQLENGAEVFRVQQTMAHLAKAFFLRDFHTYVLTNGIFASLGTSEHSEIRSIPHRSVHLGRVEAINDMSRKISSGEMNIIEAEMALEEIRHIPLASPIVRIVASAISAFSFCLIYGGSFIDCVISMFAGSILGTYLVWCQKRELSSNFQKLTGSALVAFLCLVCSAFMSALDMNAAIIGAFMILAPGVAFTLAIRDFVEADYLSGIIRAIDAILIAASIACGAGIALSLEPFVRGIFA